MGWAWRVREIELQVDQVHLIMNTNQGYKERQADGTSSGRGCQAKGLALLGNRDP